MIGAAISGDGAVVERLAAIPAQVEGGVARALLRLASAVQGRVQDALSGRVLTPRSGALRASIVARVTGDPPDLAVAIGSDVAYAAIHEYGGTTPAHEIRVRKAKALAFMLGAKPTFATSVQHPGSRIPERSFLRSALAEMAPEIRAELGAAVAAAVRP